MIPGRPLPELGIPPQGGVDPLLLGGVIDLQRLEHPLGEPVLPEVVLGQFGLQAANHDGIPLPEELPRVGGHAAGEPLVVQKLQQGREALRIAVVGGGRQEELVLEVRGQEADRPGAERVGGVLAPPGRGAVVRLVHDQHVVTAGVDRLPLGRERLLEEPGGPLPLQEVERGDQPREVGPRVDVDAPPAPQVPHQAAVHDAEIEPELVPHLVPPLDLERGRADDEDPPCPVPDDQLEDDEPRLDGLAQPHVVGDQQADPGHLDGPDHGVELVVLDVDARAERGLEVFQVGRRSSPPADGIEEGVEPTGGVESGGLGQGDLLDDLGPRLDLPDNLELFPEGVVLDGQQRDEVLGAVRRRLHRWGRECAGTDLAHHSAAGPDAHELALFRDRRERNGHRPASNEGYRPSGW
ncbi:MAG: hypothetical protein JO116_19375 [Planctomycetaceae bacterium]|nr:hypothetical protein [Planctomycetaceae bacterium]